MKGSVLVTGGARRIGLAICEELSARGWNVLSHSRDPENPLASDFAKSDAAADRLFAAALEAAPDLCAIVNNAAVFSKAAELLPDEAKALWSVNVAVPVRLTELLAEHLAEHHATGSVVNLLDTRILGGGRDHRDHRDHRECREIFGEKGLDPYSESKVALARATVEQARRLAPTLRVNGVAPGPVLPPTDPANREKGGDILLPRRPTPSDVASAVAFLLEADAVTGQVLAVDSGQSLAQLPVDVSTSVL
jgi:NAD(P)-dependent dehydrogenase (short-subunit alcohol dehydrogenase family)